MAQATATLTPLKRRTVKFKGGNGDQVEYHEAVCLDDAGDFVIVRSANKDDIIDLVPDGPSVVMECEFRKMGQIPAAVLRPAGAPSEEDAW